MNTQRTLRPRLSSKRGLAGLLSLLVLVPLFALSGASAANAWTCGSPLASSLNYSSYFPASQVTSSYACGSHTGVDFARGGTNFTVPTVYGGQVTNVGTDGCHGKYAVVKHSDGNYSIYAHLATVSVTAGTTIGNSAVIGTAGATGTCASGVHLHLSMTTNWTGWSTSTFFNPKTFLDTH